MKLKPAEISSIAIFRALQLGDILCSIPAIRAIRTAYPDAHISFIGLPSSEPIIQRFPQLFNDFISFPGYPGLPEQGFDQEQFDQFIRMVQEREFDLLLQIQGNGTIVNDLLATFNARHLAGFCPNLAEETAFFLTYPNHGHEVTRHLALAAHLGIPATGTHMDFPLSESDYEDFEKLGLPIKKGRYVCIHPGSRGNWRQWPPLYFAVMGDFCVAQGYNVVITGTHDELNIVNQVASIMKVRPLISAGKTGLGTIGVLLKQSYGLIANCTGVSHVAAALNVQSIIISMDGEPERWAPMDKELHRTVDWTTRPDFHLVYRELAALFFRL